MDDIEIKFKPLHDTLARLRMLTHLVDGNVSLRPTEPAELHNWLCDLTREAVDLAVEIEQDFIWQGREEGN
ncbi:MAG: hypothetical protein AB7E59_10795 [Pusillimonas sp.]